MAKDDRGGVQFQRTLDDDARINAGAIDSTVEGSVKLDDPMAIVEVEATKDFIRFARRFRDQERFSVGGTAVGFAFPKLLAKFASGALHDFIGCGFKVGAIVIFCKARPTIQTSSVSRNSFSR